MVLLRLPADELCLLLSQVPSRPVLPDELDPDEDSSSQLPVSQGRHKKSCFLCFFNFIFIDARGWLIMRRLRQRSGSPGLESRTFNQVGYSGGFGFKLKVCSPLLVVSSHISSRASKESLKF